MKKILFLIQTLLLPMTTSAQELIDGINYILDEESRTAEVYYKVGRYEGDIVVPETVTSQDVEYRVTRIGDSAFSSSTSTSITLPASVTSIGEAAFANCNFLTSVNIPEGVTAIENNTFASCYALKSLKLPNSVKSIGEWVFDDCTSLSSLDLNEGLETIGYRAFMRCRALKFLILPSTVTSIGDRAFEMCSICLLISRNPTPPTMNWFTFDSSSRDWLVVKVPPGCAEAYKKAKEWSNITHVEEYDPYKEVVTVDDINYQLFYDSRTAKVSSNNTTVSGDVMIPDTAIYSSVGFRVTEIDYNAFSRNQNMTTVTIPNSVTRIGSHAFFKCENLTAVTISNSVTSIEQEAFLQCKSLSSVTLSNSLKSLDYYVFSQCASLETIHIPASVTSISQFAFYPTDLSSISIDAENPVYDSRDNCNAVIETATNGLYMGIKTTVIPKGVTHIQDIAFYFCRGLSSITVPEGVTEIGGQAFYACLNLTDVSLPSTLTSIGNLAFGGCDKLQTVTSLNPVPPTIQDETFQYRNHILRVPYGCKEVYANATYWKDHFYLIEEMEAPLAVQGISVGEDPNVPIFDLSGRQIRHSSADTRHLPYGIYIREGKKVVKK